MNLFHQESILLQDGGKKRKQKLYHNFRVYKHPYIKGKQISMTNRSELIKKYERSQTFKDQMLKSESNYQVLLQRSLYTGLPLSECNFIQKFHGKNRMDADIYFIDGGQQYAKARQIEKLTLALITKIPKPSQNYIIVYLNDPEYSSAFSDFKTVLEIMPMQYFLNLVKILLIKPTFLEKAGRFFVFGTVPKYINSQIQNIDQVQQLSEKLVMDTSQLLKHIPNYWQDNSPKLKKKTSLKMQIGLSNQANQTNQTHHPLGVSQKVSFQKYQINQYDKSQNGLPELFQLLVYYFQEHPEGLLIEGIFRKSANIQQQAEAMQKISKKHYKCLEEIKNPHIIANLIKKFLGGLKTPIIPFNMFEEIMSQPNLTPQYLSKQMKELSQKNLTKLLTLMFLLQFLMSSVIVNASKNKMNATNISICFAPCLMWAKQRSMKDIAYATKSVQVLNIMITNFEEVFGNKKDQKKLYRQSYMQQKNRSLEAVMLISETQPIINCPKIEEDGTDEQDESYHHQKPTQTQNQNNQQKITQNKPQQQQVGDSKTQKRGIFVSTIRLKGTTDLNKSKQQKMSEHHQN